MPRWEYQDQFEVQQRLAQSSNLERLSEVVVVGDDAGVVSSRVSTDRSGSKWTRRCNWARVDLTS